jgi:hypothetical protein
MNILPRPLGGGGSRLSRARLAAEVVHETIPARLEVLEPVPRSRSSLDAVTEARKCVYHTQPTVSIVRRDDRTLVTPYLRFFVGSNSPSLELRRVSGRMFDRYVRHFQSAWDQAEDWTL